MGWIWQSPTNGCAGVSICYYYSFSCDYAGGGLPCDVWARVICENESTPLGIHIHEPDLTSLGAKTNENGSYEFISIPNGTYTLSAEKECYSPISPNPVDIDVSGADVNVDFILQTTTPTANVVSISPSSTTEFQTVSFIGEGNDPDGIIEYNWRSCIDGILSDQASFNSSSLSVGEHAIYFKAKDSCDTWSQEDTANLTINKSKGVADLTSVIPYIGPQLGILEDELQVQNGSNGFNLTIKNFGDTTANNTYGNVTIFGNETEEIELLNNASIEPLEVEIVWVNTNLTTGKYNITISLEYVDPEMNESFTRYINTTLIVGNVTTVVNVSIDSWLVYNESQSVIDGLNYLVNTQNLDGGWGESGSDILTTTIVLDTLITANANATSIDRGFDYLEPKLNESFEDVGLTARMVLNFLKENRSTSMVEEAISWLESIENKDGGRGYSEEYRSNAMDTLLAAKVMGTDSWLVENIENGTWDILKEEDVFLTSEVMKSLVRDANAGEVNLSESIEFLESQENLTFIEKCAALSALLKVNYTNITKQLVSDIESNQSANGSFGSIVKTAYAINSLLYPPKFSFGEIPSSIIDIDTENMTIWADLEYLDGTDINAIVKINITDANYVNIIGEDMTYNSSNSRYEYFYDPSYIGIYNYTIAASANSLNLNYSGTFEVKNITLTVSLDPLNVGTGDPVEISGRAVYQNMSSAAVNNTLYVWLNDDEWRNLSESDWWDSSWKYKCKITLSETLGINRTNEPIVLNGSQLYASGTKCKNIYNAEEDSVRIIDFSMTEVPVQVNDWNSNKTAVNDSGDLIDSNDEILFLINVSAYSTNGYWLYYGNPDAPSTSVSITPTSMYGIFTAYTGNLQPLRICGQETSLGTSVSCLLNGSINDGDLDWCTGFGCPSSSEWRISRATNIPDQEYEIHISGGASGNYPGITGHVNLSSQWKFTTVKYCNINGAGYCTINNTQTFSFYTRGGCPGCLRTDGGRINASVVVVRRTFPEVLISSEKTITQTDSDGYYNYTFIAPFVEGIYTIKVNLTDVDGIYGENSTWLTVYATPPQITIHSPPNASISDSTPLLNTSEVEDNPDTMWFSVDDGTNITGTTSGTSFEVNLTDSSWWNPFWKYKQRINITNNNDSQVLEEGYTVNITLNHSALVGAGKSNADGSDVRIVWYNTSSGQHKELDRINTTNFNNNNANATIWFNLVENISAGGWDANYSLYYGNLSASAPSDNANVHLLYDGFEDGDYTNNPTWTGDTSYYIVQSLVTKNGIYALRGGNFNTVTSEKKLETNYYDNGGNRIIEVYAQPNAEPQFEWKILLLNESGDVVVGVWKTGYGYGGGNFKWREITGWSSIGTSFGDCYPWICGNWHRLKVEIDRTNNIANYTVYETDDVSPRWNSIVSISPDLIKKVRIEAFRNNNAHAGDRYIYTDDFKDHNPVSPEPTSSLGAEENSEDFGLEDGSHNVTVYANDMAGNLNSSTRYFTVDAPPRITIESPLNKTYASGSIDFNITVNQNLTNAFVSIDGGPNKTMENDTWAHYYNITITVEGEGYHNATFWANDTSGNSITKTVYFSIDLPPTITIHSPLNATTSDNTPLLYASEVEINPDAMWFNVDGKANITGTTNGTSFEVNLTNSDWWSPFWSYRQQINITNNNDSQVLEEGYTVNITLNHSEFVSAGKSLANGSDVRIVWYNTSSGQYKELDRINVTSFNDVNTVILFRTQASIPASGSDDNYWVYYGNRNAGSPPANGSEVYLAYDDFDSYSSISDPEFTNNWYHTIDQGSTESGFSNGEFYMNVTGGVSQNAWSYKHIMPSDIEVVFDYTRYSRTGKTDEWRWETTLRRADYTTWVDTCLSESGPARICLYHQQLTTNNLGSWDGSTRIYNTIDSGALSNVGETVELRFIAFGGNLSFYSNGTYKGSLGINYEGSGYILLKGGYEDNNGESYSHFDDFSVRQYLSPEPTISIGVEDNGGLEDGPHNVTVYANDSAGNINSSTVWFTVDTAPLKNLTITYNNDRTINLTWDGTATSYDIYITNNYSAGFDLNNPNVTGIINKNWTDENASLYKERYYKVGASGGNVSNETVGKFDIELYSSLNLVSLPLIPQNNSIIEVMHQNNTFYPIVEIASFIANGDYDIATFYPENAPYYWWSSDNFSTLANDKGYWFKLSQDYNFTLVGGVPSNNRSINLEQGMNLVGWTSVAEKKLWDAIYQNASDYNVTEIASLNASGEYMISTFYSGYTPNYWWSSDSFNSLSPSRGYWFKISRNFTWNYEP